MGHQIRVPLARPDDLSLISEAHRVGEDELVLTSSLTKVCLREKLWEHGCRAA